MSVPYRFLLTGIAALSSGSVVADPVTYQFEGLADTLCIVADIDRHPQIPPPDGIESWSWNERDTVWESTENGITQYDVRWTRNIRMELEGVEGSGWSNIYYSHFDYPYSQSYSFDAEMSFNFSKGDRILNFALRGGLLQDYPGQGTLAHGMGETGIGVGAGITMERFQGGLQEPDIRWLVLTRITPGEAACPGKEKAWKFRVDDGIKPDPGCKDGPGHSDHGRGLGGTRR
jgi:hypothetical protein